MEEDVNNTAYSVQEANSEDFVAGSLDPQTVEAPGVVSYSGIPVLGGELVNKSVNAIQKMGFFLLGFISIGLLLALVIITDSTWNILDMPGYLLLLNTVLIITSNILAIIYFTKRNKPRRKFLSWGILSAFVVSVLFLIAAAVLMGMVFSNILG